MKILGLLILQHCYLYIFVRMLRLSFVILKMPLNSVEIAFKQCGWLGQVPQPRLALLDWDTYPALLPLKLLSTAIKKVKFCKS